VKRKKVAVQLSVSGIDSLKGSTRYRVFLFSYLVCRLHEASAGSFGTSNFSLSHPLPSSFSLSFKATHQALWGIVKHYHCNLLSLILGDFPSSSSFRYLVVNSQSNETLSLASRLDSDESIIRSPRHRIDSTRTLVERVEIKTRKI